MRILIINDDSSPAYGSHLQALWLRDGLRRKGHDARLFSSDAHPLVADRPLGDFLCRGSTSRAATLLQTVNPWAFVELRRVLATFRPQVAHVHTLLSQLSPVILPLLRRVPSVYQPNTYRSHCPLMRLLLPDGRPCPSRPGLDCFRNGCMPLHALPPNLLELALWRRWQGIFRYNIAISEAVRRRLFATTRVPTEVLWHAVPARPARPPLGPVPTVGFAGRLIFEKGIFVLVAAFRAVVDQLPTAHLLLAGDGPERLRLERRIAEQGLGAHVTVLGRLPHAELERRFEAVWTQVAPSLVEETFGLVAAEAMMRGCAAVVSATGGLGETVQHGRTGLHVAPGDSAALAEALLRLLRDRDLAETMGAQARVFAQASFDEELYLEKVLGIYRRAGAEG